jgi:arginine decarboxylase
MDNKNSLATHTLNTLSNDENSDGGKATTTSPWTYKKSRDFYNIQGWGNSYFDINKAGEITVKRSKYLADKPVAIATIIAAAKNLGCNTPIVLRFTDIVQSRALRIIKAFYDTKKLLDYSGSYTLIYPIKVNQHKAVVDSIISIKDSPIRGDSSRGDSARVDSIRGLEAGSKPELLAVLSSITDNKTPIICNGYKDREYIKTALIARKCGRNITIVIEKMPEAKYVIELCKELNVEPLLGMRFRLALTLAGKWAHSGGEKSKFGFNTTQILDLIKLLRNSDMLQYLHLLHCHQGSQIANIKDIFHYINELSTAYVELYKLGVPLKILDIGGGLAVDYEGSRTRSFNSTNYSLSEYAHVILATIKQTTESYMFHYLIFIQNQGAQ